MSDYSDEYDDEETEVQGDGPKALRDKLKKESAEKRAALKRLEELEAKFAEAEKVNRATTLKEALTAVGGDAAAKIAKFYPSDSEVTADAVKSWLDENKDTFNLGAPAAAPAAGEQAEPAKPLDPAVQAYLDARSRSEALEQDSVENPGDERLLAAIEEVGNNAKTMQELTDGLSKLGAPVANTGYRR